MAIDYGLDVENSAIFYLFDRDRGSNRPNHIKPELEKHGNSRVSIGYDMNGLFLLSYPSVEAYLSTANRDNVELESGKLAKCYIAGMNYSIYEIDAEKILEAASSMISSIEFITKVQFKAELLDNFAEINKTILNYQDEKWAKNHTYITLSLLSASLIDLGIITVN